MGRGGLNEVQQSKCRVLHLKMNNCRHQDRVETDLLEKSPKEKDFGVTVDKKVTVRQQGPWGQGILWCFRKSTASR